MPRHNRYPAQMAQWPAAEGSVAAMPPLVRICCASALTGALTRGITTAAWTAGGCMRRTEAHLDSTPPDAVLSDGYSLRATVKEAVCGAWPSRSPGLLRHVRYWLGGVSGSGVSAWFRD